MFIIISFPILRLTNKKKTRPKPSLNPVQMPLLNNSFKGLNVIIMAFLYFSDTQVHVKAILKCAIEFHP